MSKLTKWIEKNITGEWAKESEYRIDCPYCDDEKRHMYVHMGADKPVAHCFRCQRAVTHFRLVRDCLGADSYAEAWGIVSNAHIADLERYFSVTELLAAKIQHDKREQLEHLHQDVKTKEEMPDWFKAFRWTWGKLNQHAAQVLKYTLSRMTPNLIRELSVGFCDDPDEDKYRWRMVIPVEQGYFQARLIGGGGPKYLNPPVMGIGGVLFNSYFLGLPDTYRLYVTEGIISALAFWPAGVAILGKRASKEQLRRLANCRPSRITVAFDADASFSDGAMEIAEYLAAHDKKVTIREYERGDPDSSELWHDAPFSLRNRIEHRLFSDASLV